jgi:hypothetical protein
LRADKATNRKKQNTLKKEQRIEQEKFDKKYNQQDDIVQAIQTKIDVKLVNTLIMSII